VPVVRCGLHLDAGRGGDRIAHGVAAFAGLEGPLAEPDEDPDGALDNALHVACRTDQVRLLEDGDRVPHDRVSLRVSRMRKPSWKTEPRPTKQLFELNVWFHPVSAATEHDVL